MKTFAVSGRRQALVIAPHPDDETIGAYGLIAKLRRSKVRVRIIVVSDGSASHPGSTEWPPRRLVAERRRESRTVLRRIGVAAGDIMFLGLPDSQLATYGTWRARLARAVSSIPRIGFLALPDASDAHPDHRAVADALRQIWTPGAQRLSYVVWTDSRVPRYRPTHGLKLGPARAAKYAAIMRYRTQTGAITDDPQGFAIARHELAQFARPIELYRKLRR